MTGAEAERNEAEPNVWVAHLRDGIQAVGLHTGRTVCKLHLASPGLHVDLNGDGVLDHLQATGKWPFCPCWDMSVMCCAVAQHMNCTAPSIVSAILGVSESGFTVQFMSCATPTVAHTMEVCMLRHPIGEGGRGEK